MLYTKKFLNSLGQPLIGVDEVGRGCLAGPVYAAAVLFKSTKDNHKYKDSKQISEEQRRNLSDSICQHHHYSIGIATIEEVDQFNIRVATFMAMTRAIEGLKVNLSEVFLLIDGRDKIPNLDSDRQLAIIQGDDQVRVISAASIVAKVARDVFMSKLAEKYQHYGFEKHKGYGTLFHRQQIQKHGPSVWHRKTFSGVKEFLHLDQSI